VATVSEVTLLKVPMTPAKCIHDVSMCEMCAGGHETDNLKKQHFFLEGISKSSEQ